MKPETIYRTADKEGKLLFKIRKLIKQGRKINKYTIDLYNPRTKTLTLGKNNEIIIEERAEDPITTEANTEEKEEYEEAERKKVIDEL